MQRKFLKFIEHHNLFAKDDKILLAVSGGLDSVVLATLFHQCKRHFGIAHCNFQLRGKESDGDEDFVKSLAGEMKVPFHNRRFETLKKVMSERISTQMAARELRYKWFDQLVVEEGYAYIATAHHLNDSIETILFNLTKGTGIAGLHGIKVKVQNIIRPILFAERDEIHSFARAEKLQWREDSSNLSDKYHRNLIRNKVIPLLKEINPGLENTLEQTIKKIQATEEVLYHSVTSFKNQYISQKESDIWIDFISLNKQPGKAILLYEIIKEYGFNFQQATDILTTSTDQSGSLYYAENYQLNVDRKHLIISPKKSGSPSVQFGKNDRGGSNDQIELTLERKNMGQVKIDPSPEVAMLDYDKLNEDLILRTWEKGDRFYPLGMSQQKKLSDFMIDEKIPVNLKAKTFVLTSGEDIVWVVGYRINDHYKITNETKRILIIKKLPNP